MSVHIEDRFSRAKVRQRAKIIKISTIFTIHSCKYYMGFWNRKSKDPLLRVILDNNRLNLLSIPRESVAVGDYICALVIQQLNYLHQAV